MRPKFPTSLAKPLRFAFWLGFVSGSAVLTAQASPQVFTEKPVVAESEVKSPSATPAALPTVTQSMLQRGPSPSWIWGDDANKTWYLRKQFPGGASGGKLWATADNKMRVFLNGKEIASSTEWQEPVIVDIKNDLKPDQNELVVEVKNDGGVAAFACKLALIGENGRDRFVLSDRTWRATPTREGRGGTPVKVIGRMGDAPWGDVLSKHTSAPGLKRGVFQTLPGFKVERLFTVPREQLGSWVSITFDPRGRLIASDQDRKGLVRITLPKIGTDEETKVEHLNLDISAAQGMLFVGNDLYLSVNGGPGSGLYRARDTNGDGDFEEVTKLASIHGGGEHGPHALRLHPDGKSILIDCGNHTDPPPHVETSPMATNFAEDLLLPRQWDANGHAVGRMSPGGWIAKVDLEGKTWELVSVGYRNSYDFDLNKEGELFAYDADMEWDFGMPWYRPTRVCHAIAGSEFGWRSGTGKFPPYYVDTLPPAVEIGPGSPVGVSFGYGAKFPAQYQKALYILDWTFGTIYAIHLTPEGSTFKGRKEEFLSRTPLPLTDVAIGPDGAMYFTVGGRGTQSELYRVTYVGSESTAPAELIEKENADLRDYRRKIESYHVRSKTPEATVEAVWPALSHADRFIRFAARVALELQPVATWQDKVVAEKNPEALITSAVALARHGHRTHQRKLLAALEQLDYAKLTDSQKLELLRAYQIVFTRMGEPEKTAGEALARKLNRFYPAATDEENRELLQLLVYLNGHNVVEKTMAMIRTEHERKADVSTDLITRNSGYGGTIAQMLANRPDAQSIALAFALRNQKTGWMLSDRKDYFQFLQKARGWSGGASYQGFINNIDKDAWENCSEAERLAVEASGARKPYKAPQLPQPKGPGKEWTLEELLALSKTKMKGRSFENGKRTFAAARCIICHRFGGDGGATGPDLTQAAGRFAFKDMAEAVIDPSKVVSDQYKGTVIATNSGKVYTGRVVNESIRGVTLLIDPEDSTKIVEVPKADIDEKKALDVSLMPKGLFNSLNETEVLDLIAYLLSRGDKNDPAFRGR